MRVIPVIDLLGGQVVRGIAGRRDEYRPIVSTLAANAQPAAIARAFAQHFGLDTAYVADLDAIVHQNPSVDAWREIAAAGLTIWLDAGVGHAAAARRVVDALEQFGIEFRMVVGLETLESLAALEAIANVVDHPIVSIDLKSGRPLTRIDDFRRATPLEIGRTLHQHLGIEHLIVLDLADVGMGGGTSTLGPCRQIADELGFTLTAGGGVRGLADLESLFNAGCQSALVASALHDGRLTRADIERARSFAAGNGSPRE